MNVRALGRQRATAATLGLSAAAAVGVATVGALAHHDTVASRAAVNSGATSGTSDDRISSVNGGADDNPSLQNGGSDDSSSSSQSGNANLPSLSGPGQGPSATSGGS